MSPDFESLTPDELLQFEEACDRFEMDLRNGVRQELEAYVESGNAQLRTKLQAEFRVIQNAVLQESNRTSTGVSSETLTDLASASVVGPGLRLGKFELIKQLGAGATSSVWSATDLELQRTVAIKVLSNCSPELSKRFARESVAIAKLRHENIVSIHQFNSGNPPFLVCDYVDGKSLAQRLDQNPYSIDESLALMVQVTDAVSYSHLQGVVHRDIKPHNMLIDDSGKPFLTDFGLAQFVDADGEALTREGEVVGTPAYMAPEQATANASVDNRTDIYSLGVVLFQLLTGDIPFRGNLQSVMYQIINRDPPSPKEWNREIPVDLETICLKCLAKEPNSRFQSAEELREELSRVTRGEPIRSRPISRWERTQKWVQRNPVVAAMTVALAILMSVMAFGGATFGFLMSEANRQQIALRLKSEAAEKEAVLAVRQKEIALLDALEMKTFAERKATESSEVLEFMRGVFREPTPVAWVVRGSEMWTQNPPSLADIFSNAAGIIIDGPSDGATAQATLHDYLGDSCRSVGLYDKSAKLLVRGQEIRRSKRGEYKPADYEFETVRNQFFQAHLKHDQGLFVEAAKQLIECSKIQGASRERELLKSEVAFCLGRIRLTLRDNAGAEEQFEQSLKIRKKHLPLDSFQIRTASLGLQFCKTPFGQWMEIPEFAELLAREGWLFDVVKRYANVLRYKRENLIEQAIGDYRKIIELLTIHLGRNRPLTLLAKGEMAGLLWTAGHYNESFVLIEGVLSQAREMAPSHQLLNDADFRLARELARNGEPEKAIRHFQFVLASSNSRSDEFDMHNSMIWSFIAIGKLEQAKHSCDLMLKRKFRSKEESAWALFSAARVWEKSDIEKSKEFEARSLKSFEGVKNNLKSGVVAGRMAKIALHHGQLDRALGFAKNAVKFDIKRFHQNHPRVANRKMTLAKVHLERSELEPAVKAIRESLAIRLEYLPVRNSKIDECRDLLRRIEHERAEKETKHK